jgi:hypothetical protein
MRDSISISFKNGKSESVALFNHWGGKEFLEEAKDYANRLIMDIETNNKDMFSVPLDRFEPCTVMVDFIRDVTFGQSRVKSSLYLGKDGLDGDNSDNGHYVIEFLAKDDRTTEVIVHE